MATVKRGNVPATHPTVYVGLALAVVGLILAMYAYTGARVYEIAFAFVAVGGGVLALVGILVAAWGRSIMAARASRSRRASISRDALGLTAPEEAPPTVASPPKRKGFSFGKKREEGDAPAKGGGAVFAFKRREVPVEAAPERVAPAQVGPEPVPTDMGLVRVTLRCPDCGNTFTTEGVRPFPATCGACGFAATV